LTTSLCATYEKPEKALLLKARFSELPELKNSSRYFIGSKSVAWQYCLTPNRLKNTIEIYKLQVRKSLSLLQSAGIEVLFTVKHHRKLAIIDREIIYEDSLNIFSYRDSCEIMRRTTSALEAEMLVDFIGLNKFMEVK
jgi:hypothetical protein